MRLLGRAAGPGTVAIHNRVLLTLMAGACVALAAMGFVSSAPNRLADGVSLPLWRAPDGLPLVVWALIGALAVLSMMRPRALCDWLELGLATALALVLLVAAGALAQTLVRLDHPAQRDALGPAFWCAFAAACLAMLDGVQRLALGVALRLVFLLLVIGGLVVLARFGVFDALSLTRELQSHRDVFVAVLLRHLFLVVSGLALSALLCAPLVVLVRRSRAFASAVYAVLGVVQTIPSIALFGLLIAPLTALAAHIAVLKAIGVSGLGTTPALIALVLYAAFPLVRISDAAFAAVPPDVADAAVGLGFGPARRFLAVDLPLALPILLSGLRVVTLQAIGLATVAALIGGGGLGTFIFQGIGEYALDLVLVGAIPVILLALATDFGFRLLQTASETTA